MDLEEIGINAGNWVDSAQNRDSPCEYGIEPPGSINLGVSYEMVEFLLSNLDVLKRTSTFQTRDPQLHASPRIHARVFEIIKQPTISTGSR